MIRCTFLVSGLFLLVCACASSPNGGSPLPGNVRALVGSWREVSPSGGYSARGIDVTCAGALTTRGFDREAKNAPIRDADGWRIRLKVLGVGWLEEQATYSAALLPVGDRLDFEGVTLEKVAYPDCEAPAPTSVWGMFQDLREAERARQAFEPIDALTPKRDDTYPYFAVAHASHADGSALAGAEGISTVLDASVRARVTEVAIPSAKPGARRPAGIAARIPEAFARSAPRAIRDYALAYSLKFSEGFDFAAGGKLPGFRRTGVPGASYGVSPGWSREGALVVRFTAENGRFEERAVKVGGESLRLADSQWISLRFGIRSGSVAESAAELWIVVNGERVALGAIAWPSGAAEAPDEIALEVLRDPPPKGGPEASAGTVRLKAFGHTGGA